MDGTKKEKDQSSWWNQRRNDLAYEAANGNYDTAREILRKPNTQVYALLDSFYDDVKKWEKM